MENAINIIMKPSLLILFLLLLFNCCHLQNNNNQSSSKSLNILAVVPTSSNTSMSHLQPPRWERGDELISAAEYAMNEITKISSQSTNTYQVNIVPIQVKLCNPLTSIEAFVEKLISLTRGSRNKTVAIVGYFCDNLVQFFSPLIEHDSFEVIQISAMPPIVSNTDYKVPQFHHILPSSLVLAKVTAMLIHRLGLSEIGVISGGQYHDQHYSRMAEAFLPIAKMYNISVVSHITGLNLTRIKKSSARVYLVFLPPSAAIDVICNAYLQDFIWPLYAWVYVEFHSGEIGDSSKHCSEHTLSIAKESIILVHFNSFENTSSYLFNIGYEINNSTFTESPADENSLNQHNNVYANALYDSILAIALALKQSLTAHLHEDDPIRVEWIEEELKQLSFQGATGSINFSQNPAAVQVTVGVAQMHDGEPIEIGSYDTALHQFTFLNLSKLENAVGNTQDHLYRLYPPYLMFTLSALLILCLIFTTATVSLFIHYRKTPKVKATSFALSLCMFVGCYGLILSSLIHTIFSGTVVQDKVFRYAICWGNTFLFTVSIDLVLATVFAKTLRIYHIFNKFGKINRLWSDKGLFVLILAITSIKVAIMIIWALVDMNHLIDETSPLPEGFPPHYTVVQKCYSHHLSWWITIVFGYTVALLVPMLHVAILTRKVSRKEFKDSKAITTLVAVLFVLTCIGNALWFLLRMIDAAIASKVVYSLAFSSAAILCQVFLFVPKIVPPVFMLRVTRIKNRLRLRAGSYTKYAYRRISQTQ